MASDAWQGVFAERVSFRAPPAISGLDGSCALWTGAKHERGYGRIRWHGRTIASHRLAWRLETGGYPPVEMMVLHHCDRPGCVEPTHLYLGTAKDNYAAMRERGRAVGNASPSTVAACDEALERIDREMCRLRKRWDWMLKRRALLTRS
ncbi:MAG: hypothetical protein HKN04_02215 [Rhodothermaceae bacterium]|nr:hypothetical protein [Rhodothermaceae bacterium]